MKGLVPYIDIHTHSTCIDKEVFCVESVFPQGLTTFKREMDKQYASGVHPWHAAFFNAAVFAQLEAFIQKKVVSFVGEIGLDKVCGVDFEQQKEVFRKQLRLAKRYRLPVILHCVKAYQEVLVVLKEERVEVPVVFHAFRSSVQMAKQLVKAGCFLSFGLREMQDAEKFKRIVDAAGRDAFFLETDDSVGDIRQVYASAAKLLSFPCEELKAHLCRNFQYLIK